MAAGSTADESERRIEPVPDAPCTCYCLVRWIAPIAAPFVPALPTTISNYLIYQVDTEDGEEFWSADVNEKSYVCNTQQVLGVTPQVLNLVHNTYQTSRSRWWFFGWGAWSAWSPKAKGPLYTNAKALGTSAPPALPECTTVGIACP